MASLLSQCAVGRYLGVLDFRGVFALRIFHWVATGLRGECFPVGMEMRRPYCSGIGASWHRVHQSGASAPSQRFRPLHCPGFDRRGARFTRPAMSVYLAPGVAGPIRSAMLNLQDKRPKAAERRSEFAFNWYRAAGDNVILAHCYCRMPVQRFAHGALFLFALQSLSV